MAKKKDIERLLVSDLTSKIRFGQSKHEAKQLCDDKFHADLEYIYSKQTYETYKNTAVLFANYCKNELHITKAKNVSELKEYMISYLDKCKQKNCSNYTLKMRRSAFNKLLGKDNKLDYFINERKINEITRSRKENTFFDKHYNRNGKYKDLFDIAESTGTRREDLTNLRKKDFELIDNHLVVHIKGSKGGRNRTAIVLNQNVVLEFLKDKKDNELLFSKIPDKIDIHSFRRQYLTNLYSKIESEPEVANFCKSLYGERSEHVKVKTDKYKSKYWDEPKDRDILFYCSESAGHSRIDVLKHYIFN